MFPLLFRPLDPHYGRVELWHGRYPGGVAITGKVCVGLEVFYSVAGADTSDFHERATLIDSTPHRRGEPMSELRYWLLDKDDLLQEAMRFSGRLKSTRTKWRGVQCNQ